jgi:predicted DNA-binding protein (UPF0251 family)
MLEEVVLLKDELEAIRLADLDEKYQQEAADNMNVSRQTFGNIIRSAHQKIADALVNGKALKIKGGVVENCRCTGQWQGVKNQRRCGSHARKTISMSKLQTPMDNAFRDRKARELSAMSGQRYFQGRQG